MWIVCLTREAYNLWHKSNERHFSRKNYFINFELELNGKQSALKEIDFEIRHLYDYLTLKNIISEHPSHLMHKSFKMCKKKSYTHKTKKIRILPWLYHWSATYWRLLSFAILSKTIFFSQILHIVQNTCICIQLFVRWKIELPTLQMLMNFIR